MHTKTGMSATTKIVLMATVLFLVVLAIVFVGNFGRGLGQGAPCVQEAGASGDFNCNNLDAFVNIGGDNTIIAESPGSGNTTLTFEYQNSESVYSGQAHQGEVTGNPIIDWMHRTKVTYIGLGALGTIWCVLFVFWLWGRQEGHRRYSAYMDDVGGYDKHIADLKADQRNS